MPGGQLRMGGDVFAGYVVDHALADAEETADPVEGGRRILHEVAVAEDQHLLARENRVQMLHLLSVQAEALVVPELRPARGDPLVLGRAGPDKVVDRIQAGRPQERPVRMCALDWVTEDDDEPGLRDELSDASLSVVTVEVEGRRLAAQRALRRGGKEFL